MMGPDAQTFGRSMGRVAAGVVALGALPAVATAGAVVSRQPDAVHPALLLVLLVYGGVFVVILGAVAYGIRRSSFAGIAQEITVLRALGQEPGAFARAQARRGLVLGARVSGGVVALGAIAQQARAVLAADAGDGGPGFNPWALPAYALGVGMAAAATSAAFALAARHATAERPPMRAVPRRLRPEAPPVDIEQFRGPRRALRRVAYTLLAALVVASVAGQVWLRFWPERFDSAAHSPSVPTRASSPWWVGPSHALLTVAAFALLAMLATWLTVRAVSWVGHRWSSRGGTTLAIAGDGLAHHTLERTLAAATMAVVMGLTAYHAAGGDIEASRYDRAMSLEPDITVTPYPRGEREKYAAGYSPEVLDPRIVEALSGDPRLIVVPVGVLYSDPVYRAQPVSQTITDDGATEDHWWQNTLAVLDPAAGGRERLEGWRSLGVSGGTVLDGSWGFTGSVEGGAGPATFTVDGVRHRTYQVSGYKVPAVADLAWAQPRFGTPPVNALYVYLADPASAGTSGRDNAASAIVSDLVVDLVGDDVAFGTVSTGAGQAGFLVNPAEGAGRNVALTVVGLMVGAGLTGALASASARTRRKDLATLAALGARPSRLRAAPGVELGTTTLVAAVVGAAIGATVAIVQSHPTLFAAGGPVDAGATAHILWWNATHAGWTYIAIMAAVAVAASVLVGALFGTSLELRSPVGELREATKQGAW